MENFIQILYKNPISSIIALLIAWSLFFMIAKKLIKIIIFASFIISIYIGYLIYSGQDLPFQEKNPIERSIEEVKKIEVNGEKTLKKVIETINEYKNTKNQPFSSSL